MTSHSLNVTPSQLPTRDLLEGRLEEALAKVRNAQGIAACVRQALKDEDLPNGESIEYTYQRHALESVTDLMDDIAAMLDPVRCLDPASPPGGAA